MQNQQATFLDNIKPADRLAVAQAVSSSIKYINAKLYKDKPYRIKRLYKSAYWNYNDLSKANKQNLTNLNLSGINSNTRKQYSSQAYKYIQNHYVPKFLSRIKPQDRLNYATVIRDQSFLDYESTQKRKSKRIPKIEQERTAKWMKLPAYNQKDLQKFHQQKPGVFDKMHFKAANYVKLHTPSNYPHKSTHYNRKPTQQNAPQSGKSYYPHYHRSYTPKKTNTFLDNLGVKDRTPLAKAVTAYYDYAMSSYDLESYGDVKEMSSNKKKLDWACKYLSTVDKGVMKKLEQNRKATHSNATLDRYADEAHKYLHDAYTPKFLFHVPKASRYSYATVLNDQGYLDFQKQHHFQSLKTPKVKADLNKAWNKLPQKVQISLTNFHDKKPQIFDKMHFKAINYLSLHNDDKVKEQRAEQAKENLKYAPKVVQSAQNKRATAKLVVDYSEFQTEKGLPLPISNEKYLENAHDIMEQRNEIAGRKQNLIKLKQTLKNDVPTIFNKLSKQDKQNFRNFTSQSFNRYEYGVLRDQAYAVIHPSAPQDLDRYDRQGAVTYMNDLVGHAPKHLRPSIQNRLVLQYISQSTGQPVHSDLKNAEDIALHAKVNKASYKKTQQDQAQAGDVGSFLKAKAEQDAKKNNSKKHNKSKGTWHQMTKQNKEKRANTSVSKRPTNNQQPTEQQKKQMIMNQKGQSRK